MKFVKANLDLLIAGLIVVLGIGGLFWPIGTWEKEKIDEAAGRIKFAADANNYIFTPNKPIQIPGYGPVPAPNEPPNTMVTYGDNLIKAKVEAQKKMQEEADAIAALAADRNHQGRVKIIKGSKKAPDHYIPLLPGPGPDLRSTREEDHFLPAIQGGDTWDFKAQYQKQFAEWNAKLGYPDNPQSIADEITNKTADALKAKVAAAQAGAPVAPGPQNAAQANVQLTPEEKDAIAKGVVSNRAAATRCYVDDTAFQRRQWITGNSAPNEMEIFEALVDSWLQNDVVKAIAGLNEAEYAAQKLPPSQRNVGKSPVKRLEGVTVGATGLVRAEGAGPLFVGMAGAAPVMGGGPAGAPLTGTDFSRSVTGHVGDNGIAGGYDVAWMTIRVDLDPAYLNKFIDELYRQNNGYTVLNIKTSPIDPLDAASNAYLYGDTQCVHVEILVEDILFRSWTVPLMPDELRRTLGIAAVR